MIRTFRLSRRLHTPSKLPTGKLQPQKRTTQVPKSPPSRTSPPSSPFSRLSERTKRFTYLPRLQLRKLGYKELRDRYNASGDSFVVGVIKVAMVMFLAYHAIFTYGFEISWPTGASMLPTFALGHDCIIISKLHRRGKGIEVGDIVALHHPIGHNEGHALPGLIKRVIGMPGDFVSLKRKGDGDDEKNIEDLYELDGDDGWMVQVPEGHFWMEGDNLNWSRDSRVLGAVPLALIRGKVVARIFPWKQRCRFKNPLKELGEKVVDDMD